MSQQPKEPWPQLRQELALLKGPLSEHGAPTYTLHDPVAHRFFRLGWLEMEIISRWRMADMDAIAENIAAKTTLDPTPDDIKIVVDFVRNNALAVPLGPQDSARLSAMKDRQKVSPFMFMVKNYLFLRVPLFKPDRFLARTLPFVRPLFSRASFWFIVLATVLALIFIFRNASFFQRELEVLFSVQGAFMVIVAMSLSKAAHELGHAYAAKLLGLRVPSMGIALMCFYPVLWTDSTEAWKCVDKKDRLLIGLAGVGAELGMAAIAALAWLVLPSGLMREMALTLAGVTWVSTLVINANPFMRYDAYYILSDFFEMPMLQNRAFALGKWYLRKKLLGLKDPIPEPMSPEGLVGCLLYAYGTWIYRFFLFLGIAFLVYHMFFKVLGIVLFLIEIIWFVLLPIFKEIKEWAKRRADARLTPWGVLVMLGLAAFFVPWSPSVMAPAILSSEKSFTFHAPQGAVLRSIPPLPGTAIEIGQTLIELYSPDLDFNLASNQINMRSLEHQIANSGVAQALWSQYAAKREELAGLMAEEESLLIKNRRLAFVAPFSGVVRETAPDLIEGQWVSAKEPLLLILGGRPMLEAMVLEEDLARIKVGDAGIFISSSGTSSFKIKVESIAPGALAELVKPALASLKGGPLPTRQGPSGQLWPERAVYFVRCEVEGLDTPAAALVGQANIHGLRESLAWRWFRWAWHIVIEESGI